MSFLDDIRKQPQHIREIMFGLAVFVTILMIGMIWFRSFQRNIYVLLNPEEGVQKSLAVENVPAPSLFGYIWQATGNIKGLISGLFEGQPTNDNHLEGKIESESGKVYTLPLSDYK